ncbi:MAG: M24 family metallopeptidase [Planctomycetota bacterium]|jgi:Xaa-Pro aminopeptidase
MSETVQDRLPPSIAAACRPRLERLRDELTGRGVTALLVSHDKDIRYLSGFGGEDSLMVVWPDGQAIISDARHEEFLEPWSACGLAEVIMGTRHRLEPSVAELAKRAGLKRIGLQADHVTVAARKALASAVGELELVDIEGVIGRLRMCKDDVEVAAIERAAVIQQEALTAALAKLHPGMSELALCAQLEYEMKTRGAFGPSFDTMVATGSRSSVIHHKTGQAAIGEGALLIDWGAVVDGYCSDMTRTFAVRTASAQLREIYQIVYDAQQEAIAACEPGRTCAEVDAVARRHITAAGYGEHFSHGLGHGLGLDIHEEPYFNELATDIVLEPGMVMTVEPGIYLPGVGGVRIEDDVLITDRGCEAPRTAHA